MANEDLKTLEGIGKLSTDGVHQITKNLRNEDMSDKAKENLKSDLGSKLESVFNLDPGEVKMLNSLPSETVDTLFHVCSRAVASGGKIEYKRSDQGGPRMEIGYTESVDHKPADGGAPKSTVNAHIHCLK